MKKITLIALIFFTTLGYAQVGINTNNPDASSALEIESTTGGILIPRLTETQRDAILVPAAGLMIYQTDQTAGFYFWNGAAWTKIDGVAGPAGPQGADGNDGATGPAGPAGPTGADGATGPTGATGADGADGQDGVDGLDGVDGQDGEEGPQGEQGEQGIQGETGPAGATGPPGSQGTPGNDGQDGADGQDGEEGPQGEQGEQGIQGETGPAGATGPPGSQGTPGNDGQDGEDGPQGEQGEQGIQGETGPAGATGPPGSQGTPGNDGQNGADGQDGADGVDGQDGEEGPQGEQGEQGIQGETGPEGATGPPGSQGTPGNDGQDGADGLTAYDIWINTGNTGTEADFLASLVGADGEDGVGISNTVQNEDGTITFYYTDGTSFTTTDGYSQNTNSPNVTSVTTMIVTSSIISVSSEVLPSAGSISSKGFVWSTTPNPTVNDNYFNSGGGFGSFDRELSDKFDPSTTYYVRAYASSNLGFAYGPESSITTSSTPSIGDYWNGGRVFYISTSFRLIATEANSSGPWMQGTPILIGASSMDDGQSNTIIMADNGSSIGISTINSNHEGYNDWYIPSLNEMLILRSNASNARLWFDTNSTSPNRNIFTSTEYDYRDASSVDMNLGWSSSTRKSYSKQYRRIRKEDF